jgi:TRAP-type C4-dicarboxylate transport system permease small subunit
MDKLPFRGESVYVSVIFAIFAILMWTLAIDYVLYRNNEESITQWLRSHPSWAVWPIAFILMFLAGMLIHLFAKDG